MKHGRRERGPARPGWPIRSGIATTIAVLGAQPACTGSDPGGAAGGSGGAPRHAASPRPAGAPVATGGVVSWEDSCASRLAEANELSFPGQAVPFPTGKPRVLYSWTTAEQAAELRAGGELFSRSEREGLGRGYVFTALEEFAGVGSGPAQELARRLEEELFPMVRYAWPNPWATRLGWPGEDYGDQLLRIELGADAWVVAFDGYSLTVLDANDQEVPIEQVLERPERIGAIYFLRGVAAGGPSCGTFTAGGNGYREFVLGNPAMVREWSLGTQAIRERLEADIAELERLLPIMRDCAAPSSPDDWNSEVVCYWPAPDALESARAYEDALALPSEPYFPSSANLVALIETLQGGLFEPDPLVVGPPAEP